MDSGVHVKGSSFASRILWVRLNKGEAGLDELARRVDGGLSGLLREGAVMAKWYPFSWFIDLNETIDQVFGSGDRALIRQLGRHGAEANLTTIYRLFFKVGTVKWILARASRLWSMHYDSGQLRVHPGVGKEVELSIVGFSQPHIAHCLSVLGWAERSIELSGGENVVLDEIECRAREASLPACTFHCRWR